jgi:rSAM/selenodomain-associated transferase 1
MRHLGVFAKHWQPGAVKTRLAVAVGAQTASELYQGFLQTLLQRLGTVGDVRTIAYTPAERRTEFERLAGTAWRIAPQSEGDLGRRLDDFFTAAFAAGAREVVVVGSDSPNLPVPLVDVAFARLSGVPVVLGPATDGGYYLIGAADRVPPIFSGVAWSTSDVWRQTIDCLNEAACPFAVLPEWYDVDDIAGLRKLASDLASDPCRDEALCELLAVVGTALERGCFTATPMPPQSRRDDRM